MYQCQEYEVHCKERKEGPKESWKYINQNLSAQAA